MASIDKTYISSYEDYRKVIDWIRDKSFTLKNGKIVKPLKFIYYPDLAKEDWDSMKMEYLLHYPTSTFELALWNTPLYLDIWLIRNCPFDFIQNRLREQYGEEYNQILNHTSVYDNYQRNGLGKKAKIVFQGLKKNTWIRDKDCLWWIEIDKLGWWYNEEDNMWYANEEAMPWSSSVYNYRGSLTKKNIVNLLKQWNLPKDTIVKCECIYQNNTYLDFKCLIK